nr:hypothetical protein [Klebsiella pneumoniae]
MALRENKLSLFSSSRAAVRTSSPEENLKEYGSFSPYVPACQAVGSGKHLCERYATETHYRRKRIFQEVQNAQALMGDQSGKQTE